MSHSRRYTVVLQADVMRSLEELAAADIRTTPDLEAFERDLSFAPQSAGILKSSGYYTGRRGVIEMKYHVSDDDRLVRIIGIRRCAHPFDVVLSREVEVWLATRQDSIQSDQVREAMAELVPQLRRDPRLLGIRTAGNHYVHSSGGVSMSFVVDEQNCRVTISSLTVD